MSRKTQKNKRCFTLIEMLIGISLTAILMGTLLFALRSHCIITKKVKEAENEIMKEVHLQQRLYSIFSSTSYSNAFFYTKENEKGISLHFTLSDQIDRNPDFSNAVDGQFSIENMDGEDCFCLTLFGKTAEAVRREIFFTNVKEVTYEFLYAAGENWEICHEWEKDKNALPYFIQISLSLKNNRTIPFAFWVSKKPVAIQYLLYPQ